MSERTTAQPKTSTAPTFTPTFGATLQRKCACGGNPGPSGECAECSKKRLSLQAKLTIGQPNDPYEQEADRVADTIMRMPDPKVQSQPDDAGIVQAKPIGGQITPLIQTQSTASHTPEVTPAIEANINSLKGGGQPLDPATRAFMEPRFGHDFSQVRVHTDTRAAESARAVNALAYTVGRDVVFGAGQYVPGSTRGERLLAHELTHVVQQSKPNSFVSLVNELASSMTIQRYVSPLDIVDYISLSYDVLERIYLLNFYKGSDKEFQLALNLLFFAIDAAMAVLPGVGGGGAAMRASEGTMVLIWKALPASAKGSVVVQVAKGLGWSVAKASRFINNLMQAVGGGGTGMQPPASGSGPKPMSPGERRVTFNRLRKKTTLNANEFAQEAKPLLGDSTEWKKIDKYPTVIRDKIMESLVYMRLDKKFSIRITPGQNIIHIFESQPRGHGYHIEITNVQQVEIEIDKLGGIP